jgi:integrase/recombinase XerD
MTNENLKNYLKKTLTISSVESYLYNIEKFRKVNKNADQYDYQKVMQYIELLRKTYEAGTIKTILASIKKYYDFLIETKIRKDNPTTHILLKDSQEKAIQLQDLLTDKELQSLLNPRVERYPFLDKRNQVIMSLLVNQAPRVGEIIQLKLSDINLEKATIKLTGTGQTNSRILPLKAEQILLFYAYINQERTKLKTHRDDQNAFLLGKLGTPIKTEDINYLISTFKAPFGGLGAYKITPTVIRQSVITNLLAKNNDLRKIQHFAGHKSPDTTEKYRQTGLNALQTAIEKLHPLK